MSYPRHFALLALPYWIETVGKLSPKSGDFAMVGAEGMGEAESLNEEWRMENEEWRMKNF
ncbi:MAG TPA: hypothetical protein VHL58_07590 [Thermoanaerobaculia bacterium]|nr:hypothetical protein [Thermoanaerobaculia bacterium]